MLYVATLRSKHKTTHLFFSFLLYQRLCFCLKPWLRNEESSSHSLFRKLAYREWPRPQEVGLNILSDSQSTTPRWHARIDCHQADLEGYVALLLIRSCLLTESTRRRDCGMQKLAPSYGRETLQLPTMVAMNISSFRMLRLKVCAITTWTLWLSSGKLFTQIFRQSLFLRA